MAPDPWTSAIWRSGRTPQASAAWTVTVNGLSTCWSGVENAIGTVAVPAGTSAPTVTVTVAVPVPAPLTCVVIPAGAVPTVTSTASSASVPVTG